MQIHPAFFWIWAIFIATSVIRLDESLFSLAVISAIFLLVAAFPKESFRFHTFRLAIHLSILAVTLRIFFAMLIGVPMPGKTLFTIPQIQLPDFLVGIRIGGEVTSQRLGAALNESLIFAAMLLLFGVANSLTAPTKILKVIPQRLYGVGVAVALATRITPQLADSVSRIRQAQYLRGQQSRGSKSWLRIGTPVLEESMSKSLDLAASLEARGYGLKKIATRYKSVRWSSSETIALLPAIYAFLLLPSLSLSDFKIALILFFCTISAAVLR